MSEDNLYNGGSDRDGYNPRNEGNANGGRQHFNGGGRPSRPRFTRSARPAGSSDASREYNGSYRPRYNNGEDYQNRRNDGDYRPARSGYQAYGNSRGKSRYGQNDRSYQPRGEQGGYRPRYNDNSAFETEGGYQPQRNEGYRPRSNGYQRNENGGEYRPRFQNRNGNGFNNRQHRSNGYDPHAKYSHKKRLEYKEENYDPTVPIRLNKFLANAGVCSRRDADKYIEAGVVSVNGQVITSLGTKVLRTDDVKFHNNTVKIEKKVYVLLNKPKGYVTTSEDPQNRKTVMDLVANACPERIYPVGRLDRNTTGVLLLTNDGELASKLTHPKFLKKKIYHVVTDRNVTAADLRQITEGITLEDGEIKADAAEYAHQTDKKQVGIEIHSGKNRIVRRIFESLGYHVTKLDRVYFAGMTKKNVRRGDWRYLTEKEVQMLRMGAYE